jgi:hypothetical protein
MIQCVVYNWEFNIFINIIVWNDSVCRKQLKNFFFQFLLILSSEMIQFFVNNLEINFSSFY